MTTSAEVELPALTVSPGGEATTTLTVRNETDIVEAYTLEVVGDCVEWTTVEPARVSLYPGTSETVTVRIAPPRSASVRAGDYPLGIKVTPAERPELTRVPETTVTVTPFRELRGQLEPRRRRGWLRARYVTAVQNLGNSDAQVSLAVGQAGEDLRIALNPPSLRLEPGESAEVGLRVRTRKLIWFGASVTWPFEVRVAQNTRNPEDAEGAGDAEGAEVVAAAPAAAGPERPEVLQGEFVQLALLPKWLLAVLAAIIALLLAWFALVRPTVQSDAKQAATAAVKQHAKELSPAGDEGAQAGGGTQGGGTQGGGGTQAGGSGTGTGTGTGTGADGGSGLAVPGTGQQFSSTIDVQTGSGTKKVGSYDIPQGKVFGITDIVAANFQGDEGLLTIDFGNRTITTIALETFRNQDYHWVTPIEVPEGQKVTASVTCEKPGTPADGKPSAQCHELLNVSGVLSDQKN